MSTGYLFDQMTEKQDEMYKMIWLSIRGGVTREV